MALKILILTPRIPFPLRDGGSIAMNQSIQAYLEQGCQVSVLSLNTSKHWVDENDLPPYYQALHLFRTVYVRTHINPLSAFFNLFSDKSYHVTRFVNKDVEKALVSILQKESFDVIQFESIYTSPYLSLARLHSKALCVCRVHNIEHKIWQHLSEHESSFLKRRYLQLLTSRLKKYEMEILHQFDCLLTISNQEKEWLESQGISRGYYLPFGVDIHPHLPVVQQDVFSCYHLGSMDWVPNVEGVQWFVEEVWREGFPEYPALTLYLAGRNMPVSLVSDSKRNLVVLGEIDDALVFSLSKNIMLVPLRSGAGIRIKILEAMALGKTIISTRVGAEGLGLTHGKEILLADSPEEFRAAILSCLQEPDKAKQMGQEARHHAETYYQTQVMYQHLVQLLSNPSTLANA